MDDRPMDNQPEVTNVVIPSANSGRKVSCVHSSNARRVCDLVHVAMSEIDNDL